MKEDLNKVIIKGKIVEIKPRTGVDSKNRNYVAGTVTVDTGDDNFIPVGFYSAEFTNDGKPNGIYKGLQTVIDEFKSINVHGREEADTVEITGARLRENFFHVAEDRMLRGFQVDSAFFNRKAEAEPGSEFITTGHILDIIEDIKDDVPTGSITVRLLVVGWNNTANVLDYTVEDPAGVAYIKSTFSAGMDVKVTGTILVKEIIETKEEEAAFGDPIVQTVRTTDRKLLITSATPPVESSLTDQDKQTMLAEREGRIQEDKEKWIKKNKSGGKASSGSAGNFSL